VPCVEIISLLLCFVVLVRRSNQQSKLLLIFCHMCAPFALWEGFKKSCQPEERATKQLRILQRALATAAVDARSLARANQHNGRKKWHRCTLAFSDATLENAFSMYYSDLRSSRMRSGMLFFCSLYIVYALIVWTPNALKDELYLRSGYLSFLLLSFFF
jgi:hypothetical protein